MSSQTSRGFYRPRELSAEVVVSVFELISVELSYQVVEQWTAIELLIAYDYAIRIHLRASDNPTRLRDEPWFVKMAKAAKREGLSVELKPAGCRVERLMGSATPVIHGPEHDIGGPRVRMAFDEAVMRERGVKIVWLANYAASCPAGERIVAHALTGRDWPSRRAAASEEPIFLNEYGQVCDHGFRPPEAHWIGNWEPA